MSGPRIRKDREGFLPPADLVELSELADSGPLALVADGRRLGLEVLGEGLEDLDEVAALVAAALGAEE